MLTFNGQYVTIKNKTDVSANTSVILTYGSDEFYVVSANKIPELTMEDGLPRYTKVTNFKPSNTPTDWGGYYKSVASKLIIDGFKLSDSSEEFMNILEPMLKIFVVHFTDDPSDSYTPSGDNQFELDYTQIQIPNKVTEIGTTPIQLKFTETKFAYVVVAFKRTMWDQVTDAEFEVLQRVNPSYIYLKSRLEYTALKGCRFKKGTNAKYRCYMNTGLNDSELINRHIPITYTLNGITTHGLFNDSESGYPLQSYDYANSIMELLGTQAKRTRCVYDIEIDFLVSTLGKIVSQDFNNSYMNKPNYQSRIARLIDSITSLKSSVKTQYDSNTNGNQQAMYDSFMLKFNDSTKQSEFVSMDSIVTLNFEDPNNVFIEEYQDPQTFSEASMNFAYDISLKNIGDVVTDVDAISQSIENLIYTSLGEYLMNPIFGTPLSAMMFNRLNSDQANMIVEMIIDIVTKNEKRVMTNRNLINVDTSIPNQLNITIGFIVRKNAQIGFSNQKLSL